MKKKIIPFIIAIIIIAALCVCFTSCSSSNPIEANKADANTPANPDATDNSPSPSGDSAQPQEFATHSVNVTTAEEFKHYFGWMHTPTYDYRVQDYESQTTISQSSSKLTVTPILYGFVEYSGTVTFRPTAESSAEKRSDTKVSRTLTLDYYGNAEHEMSFKANTTNDQTINMNSFEYEVESCNIVIIYHDEGLSGIPGLTYETITLTTYNYRYYITYGSQENTKNKTEIKNGQEIQVQYNYISYSFNKASNIVAPYEFVNTVITFDNGDSIYLRADGTGQLISKDFLPSEGSPIIIKVEGQINYYPPASYNK